MEKRPWRLVVEVEQGRPLLARVQHDQPEEAEAALALAADAARLALPLRRLMQRGARLALARELCAAAAVEDRRP